MVKNIEPFDFHKATDRLHYIRIEDHKEKDRGQPLSMSFNNKQGKATIINKNKKIIVLIITA